MQHIKSILKPLCLLLLLVVNINTVSGQIQPPGINPSDSLRKDSTQFKKTNTSDWKDESYRIFYKKLHSGKVFVPDTGIHTFHRRQVNQPNRDLGNNGTATRNLMFTPDNRMGPTLGYHVFDAYRFDIDSVDYYNTNRPYSVFTYQLGSKQEQLAYISHTQNIKPNWNVALGYRKITSPGYYNIQRTNHDNAFLTTHYQGKKLHYELYGAIVYNKEQQDENGGITNDSFLTSKSYTDRRTIPVAFKNDAFGNSSGATRRSPVSNMLRDYSVMVQHAYTWGRTDTVYNADSSNYNLKLTPRFSISHRAEVSGSRHLYQDLTPDSIRYASFFNRKFASKDSVYSRNEWFYIDNRLQLNGFLGKHENQLRFSAGLGTRSDVFKSFNILSIPRYSSVSNYFVASIQKEALLQGKWFYEANILTYFTGDYAGNTAINATIGKDLGKNWGSLYAGASQRVNNAPYSYTDYYNQYDTILHTFSKESITQLYVALQSNKLKLNAGYRSILVNNYLYYDSIQQPAQYTATFTVSQAWLQKAFKWKILVLDNELIYQFFSAGAPVNIPGLIGRHQLSVETGLFNKALNIAAGIELRYHTSYTPAGYSPFFNQFYYQSSYFAINQPEESIFFNFKVKRFRSYLMLDQVQQLFTRNTIAAPGYSTQNFMFRFGFNWVMIN